MSDLDPLAIYQKQLYFIISGLSWCICLLQIRGLYSFHNIRDLLIIQKRYPRLVIFEAIVTIFVLAIVLPVLTSAYYRYPDISWKWWGPLCSALGAFTSHIVPITEVCRIWLISYDLQFLHSSRNQRWKTLIDVSYAEKDWYLRNRGKWGNKRYISRLGLVYYIVVSTVFLITVLLMRFHRDNLYIVILAVLQFMIAMSLMGIPIYLYVKTPRNLQDRFLFHFEFSWTVVIAIVAALITITASTLLTLRYRILGFTIINLKTMCQLLPSLLSTLYISRKVSMMSEWNDGASTDSTPILKLKASSGTFREILQEILNDEQKCEAFINWMYREFCSEVILSFLEFVQFRKYIKEEIGKMYLSVDTDPYDFTLYDGMPQSTIVYDPYRLDRTVLPSFHDVESGTSLTEDTLMRCKQIGHSFFEKYIDYHAEHEINISGRLRDKYVNWEKQRYEGMNLEHFMTFYDDLIAEMIQYQTDSYARFQCAN